MGLRRKHGGTEAICLLGSHYQFEFVLQLDKISNLLLVKAFGFIHVSAHFGLNFESAQ